MKIYFIILLTLSVIVKISFSELVKVNIKSCTILTKDITTNEPLSVFDNDMNTAGSFYFEGKKYAQIEFDLGANYVIDKIVVISKSPSPELSFIVGNLIKGQGGLVYNCFVDKTIYMLECVPKCRKEDESRNGILSRKLMMSLMINSSWESLYEIKVYSKKITPSDLISEYKFIQPDDCNSKSWILTKPMGLKMQPIAHKNGTKIFLENNYIISSVKVQFLDNVPDTLKIQLSNGDKSQANIEIDMEKCTSKASTFTCEINRPTFPTRIFIILSNGVSRISFIGKTAYYPTLTVKVSSNMKENLKLTCQVNECDQSMHDTCSKSAIKTGVQFPCSNRRLIRVDTDESSDSYVIVSHGQVDKKWSNTEFSVEKNENEKMVVTMPRSYQYFGQYQCSCIVEDEVQTDIKSKITHLNVTDFIEKLVFKTIAQYKLDENNMNLIKANNNLIIVNEKELINPFIVLKISAFSLVGGITVNVIVPSSPTETESVMSDRNSKENIKAFEDNPQSWKVQIFKYQVGEIFPDFIHNYEIKINYFSKRHNLTQNDTVRLIKISKKANEKPELLKDITNKRIIIKFIYTGSSEIKLMLKENTCLTSLDKMLAALSNNNCSSFDDQVSCYHQKTVTVLMVNRKRNIASKYDYSLVNSVNNQILSNITVDTLLTPNLTDIKTKMRYVNINSDLAKDNSVKVQVELQFISKIIEDFIPCGKVLLKILQPSKVDKELVLQKSKYVFMVDLVESEVEINITLIIDGSPQTYSEKLTIKKPTDFGIKNLKIEGETKLSLIWDGIEKVANDLLVGYDVKIANTIIACNVTTIKTIFINKTDIQGGKKRYRAEIPDVDSRHSSKLLLSVQPLFLNDNRGQIVAVEKEINNTKSTQLIIDRVILSREKSFTLVPSQTNIPCPIGSVDFDINSTNAVLTTKNIKQIDKMQYTIYNLIPGRKYHIIALVRYQHGPSDAGSKEYTFETADEISIGIMKHMAQINDRVNITCQAEVGPADKYKKTVEWRRADGSSLPEGVLSITDSNSPDKAFLVMEKALVDHSGDYGCFVSPPTTDSVGKLKVIVNDLLVSPRILKMDFSQSSKPIDVKCSSSALGDGKLIWFDTENVEIKDENDNFKVVHIVTKENSVESILSIKNPSFSVSGKYYCNKIIGGHKVSESFLLYGEEKLEIKLLPKSSSLIGNKTFLSCIGQLGSKSQKVMWDVKGVVADNMKMIKISYPDQSIKNVVNIEIMNDLAMHKVSCLLSPSIDESGKMLEKTFFLKYDTDIVVENLGKSKNITLGESVNLTCIGYPSQKSMVLQWIFYNSTKKNSTRRGVIVLSSQNQTHQKTYEPIRLVLMMEKVKANEAGRYECSFKSEFRSQRPPLKSISLSVNNPRLTGEFAGGYCGKRSILIHLLFLALVTAVLSTYVI